MAKAQSSKGFTWPMLVTAWLLPLLIASTVFLLDTLNRKDAFKARMDRVQAEIGALDAENEELQTRFKSEAAWIGFVTPADTIAPEESKSNPLAWTGGEENSPSFLTYSKQFTEKKALLDQIAGFQKYVTGVYQADLEKKLSALVLNRQFQFPASGSAEDIAKLSRSNTDTATDEEVKNFMNGQAAATIRPDAGLLMRSGETIDFAEILNMQLGLIDVLAGKSQADKDNLRASQAEGAAYIARRSEVEENTTAQTIKESSEGPLADINDTASAYDEMSNSWTAISDDLGSGITEGALNGDLETIHLGIADDINAVANSKKRYNRLLSGEADPKSRFLGKQYALNSTRSVDAKIARFDRTSKMAEITVGSDQNAHQGMRFEIWARDDNGYYLRKGMLEIIQVLDRNHSSAKLIGEVAGQEVSASDDLINQIWENGKYIKVGLLGKNWGGEATYYLRAELLALLQNLGVPATNIPDVNTEVIVVGGRPDADTTGALNTHETKMLLQELSKVQLKESDIRLYLDPR